MQSVLSRIWTRVAVSISYDDNYYTTGVLAYKLDCNIIINELEHQLHYYVQFQNNAFRKGMNPFISPAMG